MAGGGPKWTCQHPVATSSMPSGSPRNASETNTRVPRHLMSPPWRTRRTVIGAGYSGAATPRRIRPRRGPVHGGRRLLAERLMRPLVILDGLDAIEGPLLRAPTRVRGHRGLLLEGPRPRLV